jgi:hypothetical protein
MIREDQGQMRDISTRLAGDARQVAQLMVRALAQASHRPELRRRALNGIDALLAAGAYGATDAVVQADL